MTHAKSQLNVLALNTGSSSLKFGLYDVGASRIERLLSGEVVSIGDKSTRCNAEDSQGSVLLAETSPIPANVKQLSVSEDLSSTAKCPCQPQSDIELSMVARNTGKRDCPLGSLLRSPVNNQTPLVNFRSWRLCIRRKGSRGGRAFLRFSPANNPRCRLVVKRMHPSIVAARQALNTTNSLVCHAWEPVLPRTYQSSSCHTKG